VRLRDRSAVRHKWNGSRGTLTVVGSLGDLKEMKPRLPKVPRRFSSLSRNIVENSDSRANDCAKASQAGYHE
jgi:hypothetical protein